MANADDKLFSGRYLVLLYASFACVLFSCIVFAVVVAPHWEWPPFLASLIVVAVFTATYVGLVRVGIAIARPDDERLRRAQMRLRRRMSVLAAGDVTFGLATGIIGAGLAAYWPVIVLGAILVTTSLLPMLVVLLVLKRRSA
ncbi:MAG: hypothetical protein QOG34_755 [Frankiaceae bacterium]|nr:hypothetical protein [Frankiaceae bacterium]